MVIALFSTGLKVERELRWREWSTVTRLLVIGMPAFIALAALFGTGGDGPLARARRSCWPPRSRPRTRCSPATSASGRPATTSEEHEPHFGVSAEAGFNDGLAFPFVLLGIAVAADDSLASWLAWRRGLRDRRRGGDRRRARLRLAALIVAPARPRAADPALDGWVGVAATLLIYGVAETLGTYGFLAVFAGGLAFRRYEHDHELNARVHDGAEIVEKFGELAVILLLGSMLTLDGLGTPGCAGWGLALLVVFVLRPLTVNLALLGSRLQRPGRARVPGLVRRARRRDAVLRRRRDAGSARSRARRRELITWTAIAVVIVSVVAPRHHRRPAEPLAPGQRAQPGLGGS